MADIHFARALDAQAPAELEARLGSVLLRGASVAARATAFALPELGLGLDLGRLTPALAAQPVVLLSHAHLDHLSAVLAYLNLRARFHAGEPARLLGPADLITGLRAALPLMPGMASVRRRLDLDHVLQAVEPGAEVELSGAWARAFALEHSVPALGWQVFASRATRPALVYALDSTTAPFLAEPSLLDAEVALVECSLVERNRRIAARLSSHAHVADWVELAPRLACDHLVLAHLPLLPAADLLLACAPLAEVLPGRLHLWAPPPAGV